MKKLSILVLSLFFLSGCKGREVYLEYKQYLPKDNIIEKVNYKKLMNLLEEDDSQIFYFGFSKCPNCQAAIKYIDSVGKDLGYKKIYYYDIYDIRKEDKDQYKNLIEKLNYSNEEKTDSGISRMRVPTVLVRKNNQTLGYETREYFIDETINDLNETDKLELVEALTNLYNRLAE